MSRHQADSGQSSFQPELAQLIRETTPYYVELPLEALDDQGSVLDALIHFTFDTLDIQHLDLRIVADTR